MVIVDDLETSEPVKFENSSLDGDVFLASKIVALSAALWDDSELGISEEHPVVLRFTHSKMVRSTIFIIQCHCI